MDTPIPTGASPEDVSEEALAARRQWEKERIEDGRRAAAAGHYISGEELERWLQLYEVTEEPIRIPHRIPPGKSG